MASTLADMLQNGGTRELLPTAHSMLDLARAELQKILNDGGLA